MLQDNFQKALDDQIVPMTLDNLNLNNGQLVNPEFLTEHSLFNIAGYTVNDTQHRLKSLQSTVNTQNSEGPT